MQALKALTTANSWNNLNQKLEELTKSNRAKEAGDIFENLCKYFLETDSKYRTKLKKVWLLKEVKEDLRSKLNLPSTDEGIDLIAETFEGKYWAIQSKYRSDPKDTLTVKGDLATFANLAFNNCKNISLGLVMTTADKPPLKTKLLKGVTFITLESFLELDDNNLEGWNLIKAKTEGKIVVPKALSPRPHQVKAIDETIKYFKTKERGKVIMPCGTGKSLTAFWIANELKAKSVLIAVPSLALLQQTLKVWTREYLIAGIKPDWLCVCSDQTVSDDQDDFVSNIYELGIDVTTDKNEIKKFLKSKGNIKVVFTTYQSGKVTAAGSKGFTFDLGIMDEAHKTVGLGTKPMAHLIHQKNIKIKNRLFMTATERLFRGDKEEYLSMDDPRDYGDLIYQLSFKEAIEANPPIISDYKIITFGISEPEIEAVYTDNKFIQIKKEIDDIKAREFATALALRKAIKKLGIRNAISFHSSIRRANNFKAQQELISKVYPEYGNLKAFHVSGDMPTNQRSSQMREFAESKGLMTNARCLTEGVDLPAIDCVVFTDPKKSKVDIVQAAGRALRLSPGKKFGYILIPLIIPENENATEAAKDTAFEEIVATIRALATHDTRIVEYLKSVSSGTVPKGGSPVDGVTKINVLTKVDEEEFNKSIQLKVWNRVAFGNWASFEEFKKIVRKKMIKTANEYFQKHKNKEFPPDIPFSANTIYKKQGFTTWGEVLGTGSIQHGKRKQFYDTFENARNYVRNLKIKSVKEWNKIIKNKKLPLNIPSGPQRFYKNKGWISWGDWFGTFSIAATKKNFDFDKSKQFYRDLIKRYNIKNRNQISEIIKNKNIILPYYVPLAIGAAFQDHPKYKGEGVFFGWGKIIIGKHWDFLTSREFTRNLKLKSSSEYRKYCKGLIKNLPKKPLELPFAPGATFRLKGWKGWGDYLGYFNKGEGPKKNFLTLSEAKKLIAEKNIKNLKDYHKLRNMRDDLPFHPAAQYKNNNDWRGLLNFFNKKKFREVKFIDFLYAKRIMKQNKIISKNHYLEFRKKNKNILLPSNPIKHYFNQWEGWDDFFGYSKFMSFKDAKKFVSKLNISGWSHWKRYFKINKKPNKLPSKPYITYKKEWKGWDDFLGTLNK